MVLPRKKAKIRTNAQDPRVPQIVQYRLQGYTWSEINDKLRLHNSTVWRLRQAYGVDDLVRECALEQLEAGTIELAMGYRAAVKVVLQAVEHGEDARGQLTAAKTVIDLVRAAAEMRTERRDDRINEEITDDELEQLARQLPSGD